MARVQTHLDRRQLLAALGGGAAAALTSSSAAWGRTSAPAITGTAWRALNNAVKGKVLLSDAPGFAAIARPNNLRYAGAVPAGIVRCLDAADIAAAIKWARNEEIPFVARSGGHSYAGHSTTPGLMIDTSVMSGISYDEASATVTVAGGARNAHVYSGLKGARRMLTHGRCMGVGASAFLLGGGIGFSMRDRGMGCDHILSTEIVLADGSIVNASEKENPDLFWACRGGAGGNFGINTSFKLRTHAEEPVTVFSITWSREPDAIAAALLNELPKATSRLGTKVTIAPPTAEMRKAGQDCEIVLLGQLRGPESELMAILAPIYKIAQPSKAKMEHVPYWQGQVFLSEDGAPGFYQERSRYFGGQIPARAIEQLMAAARAAPATSKGCEIKFFQVGGQIGAVAPQDTAYVHRKAEWLLSIEMTWSRQDLVDLVGQARVWMDRTYVDASRHTTGGAFQNFVDPTLRDPQTAYFGDNLPRLRQIKAKVDPDFIFRFAQAITPASA